MSDLVYQNYNNRCKGWVNPSNLSYGPEIISLSSFQSPAGSTTVVSIYGSNFFSYSSIRFGTFTPTVYFVNSTRLDFYVPSSLNYGTFTVQVCNGDVCSNSVNYTIDASSGFWLKQGQNIINSNGNNNGGVRASWFSRGAPVIIDNSDGRYTPPSEGGPSGGSPYQVPDNVTWIICSNDNSGTYTYYIELPNDTTYDGREITIKNICASEIKSPYPIAPLNSITPSVSGVIVQGYGSSSRDPLGFWSTLVYDGATNIWHIMQANWNLTP